MIELQYANEDKSIGDGGWILDIAFLNDIQRKLESLNDETLCADREVIEAILLIASDEFELLEKLESQKP